MGGGICAVVYWLAIARAQCACSVSPVRAAGFGCYKLFKLRWRSSMKAFQVLQLKYYRM